MSGDSLAALQDEVVDCSICPRLCEYREEVARNKRKAYRDWDYWGRPVPSFGDPEAELLIVGLAPGAHGANRTGRMFTGDASGDFLYATLYEQGFGSQPESRHREDGLKLQNAWITAAVRCAPPKNKPSAEEMNNCRPYLVREIDLLDAVRVVVTLGSIAWQNYLRARDGADRRVPSPRPEFGHGVEVEFEDDGILLLGSYHPSPQNTNTGRLTDEMFRQIFSRARERIEE